MSTRAMTWAFDQEITPAGKKFVLVAIADFADDTGYCYPKVSTLAEMTCQGESTIRAHIAALIEEGFLRTEKDFRKDGMQSANHYFLQGFEPRPNAKSSPKKPRPALQISDTPNAEIQIPALQISDTRPLKFRGVIEELEPSLEPSVEPSTNKHAFSENVLETEPRDEPDAMLVVPIEKEPLEIQHQEFIKTLSGKEKFQAQSLMVDTPEKVKTAYHTLLWLSPSLLRDLMSLATKAQKVDLLTWRAWVCAVALDIKNHGLSRVQTAITCTLLEPMEHPNRVWKFYQRVLDENRPETRTPLPRAEPKTPSQPKETAFARALRERKERDQIGRN